MPLGANSNVVSSPVSNVTGANADISYVYVALSGREFGSWIDDGGRSNPFSAGDAITTVVYIIEDILRTELGLGNSEIDTVTFDAAYADLLDVFDIASASVVAKVSINLLDDAMEVIDDLCAQYGLIHFSSGDGKQKIRAVKKRANWGPSDVDMVLDFNDFKKVHPGYGPVESVTNRITVKYGYDYAKQTTLAETEAGNDTTSQGNSVDGIATLRESAAVAPAIPSETLAEGLRDKLLDQQAKQPSVLVATTTAPKYLALEVTDIVTWVNWPSNYKALGVVPGSTDYYMVQKIHDIAPGEIALDLEEVS